ncbi:MAG: radical SAM protein [Oscillospiraceae bacterium]|nr:radical SAM protein [Oscillospiraceae bacterium]
MANILFVVPMKQFALNQEINGTLLLATKLLEAGFDAQILRLCEIDTYHQDYNTFIHDAAEKISASGAQYVCFYTLWPYYHMELRLARELKQRGLITILGGPQASATAMQTMQAMPFVDYICSGEGEHTIVPFFRAMQDGSSLDSIPGLYHRGDGAVIANTAEMPLCDLDTLPHWDDRLYLDHYDASDPSLADRSFFMPIDAGRGCPYSCTFCCTSYFWRRTYRLKSPERIVEDIQYFNKKFGIKSFWFSHDAFTTNHKLVSAVCDYILEKKLDITWRCTARIDCISQELILKMKQAGMVHIELGIESGSPRMQKLINKNLNLQRAKEMIRFLLDNKITVGLFFMYGFPEETEEDLNQTLELFFTMLDMGVAGASMSFCKFNPSTAITEKYLDELVFDPSMKILFRGIYGYQEEEDMILANKAIFPFFYHLDTPLRRNYQYLHFLCYMYELFPNSMKYVRRLYNGDNLRFYQDFYESNPEVFEKDTQHVWESVKHHPMEIFDNILSKFDQPYIPQLKELLRFVHDAKRINDANEDLTIQESYGFNYLDFRLRRPIESYAQGRTELLMQKIGGKTDMKLLRIE